ncbi:unnamed protein product [Darwinula stevensoni]|uniref:Nck-associated protein 5 n=1 Tax=Darwinula stevensoni TaxID=69355 RepID=A0A7R8X525_9CRUS|nr:unnamed protein product [Darwinula stevensoni]CAG0880416.1 unnamed protein product [Darwinula stevensoni]
MERLIEEAEAQGSQGFLRRLHPRLHHPHRVNWAQRDPGRRALAPPPPDRSKTSHPEFSPKEFVFTVRSSVASRLGFSRRGQPGVLKHERKSLRTEAVPRPQTQSGVIHSTMMPNITVNKGEIAFVKNSPSCQPPPEPQPRLERRDSGKLELEMRVRALERALREEKLKRKRASGISRGPGIESRLEKLSKEHAVCKPEKETLLLEVKRLETLVEDLRVDSSTLQQCKEDLERFSAELEGTRSENKELQTHMDLLKEKHEEDANMREVLLAQIKSLENERDSLRAELEATRAQYDKCLDDVAQQVVQALLLQKSLQEEVSHLQVKVADLEGEEVKDLERNSISPVGESALCRDSIPFVLPHSSTSATSVNTSGIPVTDQKLSRSKLPCPTRKVIPSTFLASGGSSVHSKCSLFLPTLQQVTEGKEIHVPVCDGSGIPRCTQLLLGRGLLPTCTPTPVSVSVSTSHPLLESSNNLITTQAWTGQQPSYKASSETEAKSKGSCVIPAPGHKLEFQAKLNFWQKVDCKRDMKKSRLTEDISLGESCIQSETVTPPASRSFFHSSGVGVKPSSSKTLRKVSFDSKASKSSDVHCDPALKSEEVNVESPSLTENSNRDEGYSTMSSDAPTDGRDCSDHSDLGPDQNRSPAEATCKSWCCKSESEVMLGKQGEMSEDKCGKGSSVPLLVPEVTPFQSDNAYSIHAVQVLYKPLIHSWLSDDLGVTTPHSVCTSSTTSSVKTEIFHPRHERTTELKSYLDVGPTVELVNDLKVEDLDIFYIPLLSKRSPEFRFSYPVTMVKPSLPLHCRSHSHPHLTGISAPESLQGPEHSMSDLNIPPKLLPNPACSHPLRRSKAKNSLRQFLYESWSSLSAEDLRLDERKRWSSESPTPAPCGLNYVCDSHCYNESELEEWSLHLSNEDMPSGSDISDLSVPRGLYERSPPSIVIEGEEQSWLSKLHPTGGHGHYISFPDWDQYSFYDYEPNASCDSEWNLPPKATTDINSPELENIPSSLEETMSDLDTEVPCLEMDFKRDFYRLITFESNKSLSSSLKSLALSEVGSLLHYESSQDDGDIPPPDREVALASVLKFIAEQQHYCHARERELDDPHFSSVESQTSEGNTSLQKLVTVREMLEELKKLGNSDDVGDEDQERMGQPEDLDSACQETSWVHLHPPSDLTDPQTRANLLDAMVFTSSDDMETDTENDFSEHQQLRRMHQQRRHRKWIMREGDGLVRILTAQRPSILDRPSLFFRYGMQEEEALKSFNFLDEYPSPEKGDAGSDSPHSHMLDVDSDGEPDAIDAVGISLSDSCASSFSDSSAERWESTMADRPSPNG